MNKLFKEIIKRRGWIVTLIVLILLATLSKTVNELGINYIAKQQDRNEQGIILGAEPVYFEGSSDIGILLIHGYSSSPSDFREFTDFLRSKDITVRAPLLPGHGTHPRNLNHVKQEQWREAVQSEFNALNTKKKFVLGFSMGGALALDLASKNDLDGLITFNAAIFIANRYIAFIPLVKLVETYTAKPAEDIVFFIDDDRIVYGSVPLDSITELKALIDTLDISKITEPILIFQSTNDEIILPESAEFINTNVKSLDKELVYIENSTHSNIQGREANFEKVYDFILSH